MIESRNRMIGRLEAGEVLLGQCNMYPASGIVERMGQGWDFIWIDAQHGEMAYDSVMHAVQATRVIGIDSMIRVPGLSSECLGPYADLAPSAVLVPMVSTPEQAQQVVRGVRFPPLGNRSYGGRRVIDLFGRDYYKDRELFVVAQIETLEGAENAAAIINTDGIDCLFFGPDDMRVRMGLPVSGPATGVPRVRDAMALTARVAREAGKYACCVTTSPAALQEGLDMGYQLAIGGSDVAYIAVTSAERLAELRPVAQGAATGKGGTPGRSVY